MIKVKIKENSWLAAIAADRLKSNSAAIVIGKTIYLHNSRKDEFLSDPRWVRHEVAHVKQYIKWGLCRFIALYLIETIKKGYENNRFEAEARQKEKDQSLLSEIHFRQV